MKGSPYACLRDYAVDGGTGLIKFCELSQLKICLPGQEGCFTPLLAKSALANADLVLPAATEVS